MLFVGFVPASSQVNAGRETNLEQELKQNE
jgi:hypothetical protein